MLTPLFHRDGGGGSSHGHHRNWSQRCGHKRQASNGGAVPVPSGCTCVHCPCQPRDPIKEQLCSAKLKLLKEGPQCLQQLASPPAGKLGQQQEQPERRGHRRPRQESQGREKDEEEAAELRASLKRGVLLGVLPALFAPSSSGPGKQGEDAAGSVTDLETSMSSSSGGASSSSGSSSHKAERKEGDTDGEEDEEEGDAGEGEAEERKKEGEGKTARVAYREEEEAMWAYLAQANPEERSRMLVLRDPRRVERLLALTRNVALAGLAVAAPQPSPGQVAVDNAAATTGAASSDGPGGDEGLFIDGRSARSGVYLVSESQARSFCCPCPTSAGPRGRRHHQHQGAALRAGSVPPSATSAAAGAGKGALGPKAGEGALDLVFLPTTEIPSSSSSSSSSKAAAATGWVDAADAAVDGAAKWLLNQCLFGNLSRAVGGGKGAGAAMAMALAFSSASEAAGPRVVMMPSSAALLDVPRLRATVELLLERQVWFIPPAALAPAHPGPYPPSSAPKAAVAPVTVTTLPSLLARWVLAALRYNWRLASSGGQHPNPCPCRAPTPWAPSPAPSLARDPGAVAGLLAANSREEQHRGDILAFLRVAALSASSSAAASSSCCSASCCSSSLSSAAYHGFGAEAMVEMWHGMRREERLALLARLERAIADEIKMHFPSNKASGATSSSATGCDRDAGDKSKSLLPSPRRILLHALGLVLRPHANEGLSQQSKQEQEGEVAALAEEESVGEVLLEGLCLLRLPHVYAVAGARPALTPQLAMALKRALESFYADELARRLIMEEEEQQQQQQQEEEDTMMGGAGAHKGCNGGGGSKASKRRKKVKLRKWLLKRQEEQQAQQQAKAQEQGQGRAPPEQPIPLRPPTAVAEGEDEATPAEGGRCSDEEGGPSPLSSAAAAGTAAAAAPHNRSHSAEDSIVAASPDVGGRVVGKAVGMEVEVTSPMPVCERLQKAEEGEKGMGVGEKDEPAFDRSASQASMQSDAGEGGAGCSSGSGMCSPATLGAEEEEEKEGEEEEEEEEGGGGGSHRSSYTSSPSGNSSSSGESAHMGSAASSTASSPLADSVHAKAAGPANGYAGGGGIEESEAGASLSSSSSSNSTGALSPPPTFPAAAAGESEGQREQRRRLQLCARLSGEVEEMARGLRAVAARRRPWQYGALTQLEQAVGLLWPDAQCEIYGSFTTGLCIPASDLDVVITQLPQLPHGGPHAQQPRSPGAQLLSQLSDFLGAQEWVASVRCVRHAAMPIIKLTTAPMPLHANANADAEGNGSTETEAAAAAAAAARGVIKIDISLDLPGGIRGEGEEEARAGAEQAPVHYGLQSSMFVQRLCMLHPQLPPLVLVLKQLLLQRGLSDSYTGGLTSYALTIMVAAILQPYLLEPPERQPWLGALLLAFLQTYGTATFDTRRFGVCMAPPPCGPLFALDQLAFVHHTQQQQQQQQGTPHHHHHHHHHHHQAAGGESTRARETPWSARPEGHEHGWGTGAGAAPWRPTDPVVIQDPLRMANNVGRSCFGFRQVQVVFDQCLGRLLQYGERMLAAAETEKKRGGQAMEETKGATGSLEAESVLGIALFGASHHRHVVDLAAASLCLPPSSDKEPVPGAATDGHPSGSGVHLASFGMYAFQPHHPIPQPLPFVFAIPCGASPAGMLPAYYHWAPLPSHLPTIIYAHAPAPGPGALPIVSFGPGPFPSQHVVAPYPNDWNNNWGMGGGHRGGGGYGYNSYRGHSNPFRRPSHHQQQHGAAQHCHSPRQHQQQTGAGAGAGMQRQRAGRNGEAPRLQRPNQRAYRQQQHRQHHQEEKDGRTMMDEGGTEA